MYDTHLIQLIFDLLGKAILIQERVRYDKASLLAHYIFQFIQGNRGTALLKVYFFRGAHPKHVFSPFRNGLNINQMFYTYVFGNRVTAPASASQCQ